MPDSPAAKAGLKQGDIILGFDGSAVGELRELPRLVADADAGDKVDVELWRDQQEKSLSVKIAKLEEPEKVAANDEAPAKSGGESVEPLGMELAKLTPDLRQQLDIPETVEGVVVMDVAAEGPAAEQGLQPGDVIQKVGSESVTTPAEVADLTEAAQADNRNAVLLLINRQGNELFVAVKVA
jgi:serine protease Do